MTRHDTNRWLPAITDSTDEVETYNPMRDSLGYWLWLCTRGLNPSRQINPDGSVTITMDNERPIRFVPRKQVSTVPDGNGWRRVC